MSKPAAAVLVALLLASAVPASAKAPRARTVPRAQAVAAPPEAVDPVPSPPPADGPVVSGPAQVSVHQGQAVSVRYSTSARGVPRWSLQGWPAGVWVSGGTLEGTPGDLGSHDAAVSDGLGGTARVRVDVLPPLRLTQSAPLLFRVGVRPPQRLAPSDPVGPVTYEVAGLPDGLSLSDDGTFSGAPVPGAVGRGHVDVTVSDATGRADPERGTYAVEGPFTVAPPLTIADYGPVRVVAGVPLDIPAPLVEGGPVNPSFSVSSGALPEGLALDPATGAISGVPVEGPEATVRVSVGDDSGATATTGPLRLAPSRGPRGGDATASAPTGEAGGEPTGDAGTTYPINVTCRYGYPGEAYPLYSRADQRVDACRSGWEVTYAEPVSTDGSLDLLLDTGKADATPVAFYDGHGWTPVGAGVLATKFLVEAYGSNVLHLRLGDRGHFPDYLAHVAPARAHVPASSEGRVDLARVMPPVDGRPPYAYAVTDLPEGWSFDGATVLSGTFAPGGEDLKVGHVVHVTLTDGRGTRTAPVALTLTTTSLSAATAYPKRVTCRSGYPEATWPLYADTGHGVDHCSSGWVLEFGDPVTSDGSLDLAVADGPLTAPVMYDAGRDDWKPASPGSASRRFWVRAPDVEVYRMRLGDAGEFPSLLPVLTPGRVDVGHSAPGAVDLRDAVRPLGGRPPFAYSIGHLPRGLDLVDGHVLQGSLERPALAQVSVTDASGIGSGAVEVQLQPSDNLDAGATYPTSVTCGGGGGGGPHPAYDDADRPMGACRKGWYVEFARPVTSDGTLDLVDADGPVTAPVLYDASGNGDWRTVTTGTSASTFRVDLPDAEARHLRIGDGDVLPPWLVRVDAATVPVPLGSQGTVDLARAMPPSGAQGQVTYAVRGLPPGLHLDGASRLSGAFPSGPSEVEVSVVDARGIPSPWVGLDLVGPGAQAAPAPGDVSMRAP